MKIEIDGTTHNLSAMSHEALTALNQEALALSPGGELQAEIIAIAIALETRFPAPLHGNEPAQLG